MGLFTARQVVIIPFPFSDFPRSKYRPSLLLADVGRGDSIACQIASSPYSDAQAISINGSHFAEGGLANMSYVRLGKQLAVHEDLIERKSGTLKPAATDD